MKINITEVKRMEKRKETKKKIRRKNNEDNKGYCFQHRLEYDQNY